MINSGRRLRAREPSSSRGHTSWNPKRALDFGKNAATPTDARRALAQALKRQNERLGQSEAHAIDVQLLGQVTSAAEWPKLLSYWERRNPSGVASWPPRLDPSAHALNLWPVPAGRVGRAAGLGGRCAQAPAKVDALSARPDGI